MALVDVSNHTAKTCLCGLCRGTRHWLSQVSLTPLQRPVPMASVVALVTWRTALQSGVTIHLSDCPRLDWKQHGEELTGISELALYWFYVVPSIFLDHPKAYL